MKAVLGMILGLCTTGAWATMCGPHPLYDSHTMDMNVYPDSVLWLEFNPDLTSPKWNPQDLQLRTEGKRSMGVRVQPAYAKGLLRLQPEKPLMPTQTYHLTSPIPLKSIMFGAAGKKARPSEQVVKTTQLYNTFSVLPATKLPKPAWVSYPKLQEVSISQTTLGEIRTIRWHLQTNLHEKDHYVYIRLAKKADFSDEKGFFTRLWMPQTMSVTYGDCRPAKDAFYFQFGETIWAKFDLIGHDGDIVPWQGAPMKFELQPLAPTR